MKTWKYYVKSLDVWGHNHADCKEHGCPCASSEEGYDCSCGYEINQEFAAGSIEIEQDDPPNDARIVRAMVEDGFLKDGVTIDESVMAGVKNAVMVEDVGEDSFIIRDSETDEPIYILETEDGTLGDEGFNVGARLGEHRMKEPPIPASGFGKESTSEDYVRRLRWERWIEGRMRANGEPIIANMHANAARAYEELLRARGVKL